MSSTGLPVRRAVAAGVTAGLCGLLAVTGGMLPAPTAAASPRAGTAASEADPAPPLTAASFADPPTSVRPKYRWWMPLAHTEDDELESELQQMKDAGAGGAEVAAFSVDGAGNNRNPFLETYGWGTPRWTQKVATMLSAAEQRDLSLDLTISPRWPATVPNVDDVNDPAAAQQIAYASEFRAGGTSRSGTLPSSLNVTAPAGANRSLIAVVAAKCADPACSGQKSKPRMLDRSSVVDLTSQVDDGGNLTYSFPGDAASTWALLAFYQLPTGQSLSGYTPTGTNYVLDTLSEAGARASTDFYDKTILTPKVDELLSRMWSSDFYEDSLEIGATQKWTSSFVAEWTKRRGYSPVTVLPALAGAGDQGITSKPAFDFEDGSGDRVRTDYRQTWSDLYIANRLDVFREWAHRHHMQTRTQPYGSPIDISEAAMHVDVPEGESLAFGESLGAYSNVQDYKVVATGAHLAGAPVISDECCAFSNQVWASTVANATEQSNLQAVYRGFAGGVNQVVWHGFPYLTRGPAGAGQQSTWPGMTYGGNTSWSEAFGAKNNPSWADYRSVNDHVARMQLVLRQGKPRFDVAVYWQDFGLAGTGTTGTGSDTLIASESSMAGAGYSYEYVSPAQLRSDDARYRDGALFPDSSGYRAVVLKDQETMPLDVARRLLALARSGLPVVVAGDLPRTVPGLNPSGQQDAELRSIVDELAQQRTVVRVADEDGIATALARLRVTPAAATQRKSADVLTVRRHEGSGRQGVDYYYLWNQTGAATQQTLTLTGDGVPYRLDTWTGKITPITDYTRGDGTVSVPVGLAAYDASVIALTDRRDATFHGRASDGQDGTSNAGRGAEPVALNDWSLKVDSWTPGKSGLPGDTAHTDLGPVQLDTDDGALPAWSDITPENGYDTDLSDVSGVGTYTSTIQLDPQWRRVRSAYLDLGSAVDTVRVTVNGTTLPPVNQADLAHVDVGPYLRPGANTVTVRVASTLLNAVRVAPGTGASGRERMNYGLFGPVTLTPYAGSDPYLVVEALEEALPLADGAVNVARVKVTNSAARPVRVALAADAGDGGVSASPVAGTTSVGPHESRVLEVEVRNSGASSDEPLVVTAAGDNGTHGTATVILHHTGNLAENTDGSPYPRLVADPTQDRYPAHLVVDGSASSFTVSFGRAAGQGPTEQDPWDVGVDLARPVTVGSVMVGGRSSYGARNYEIQVSDDGHMWRTVATVADAPKAGLRTAFAPVRTSHVRARVTTAWDNGTDANVQMSEFEVHPD